MRWPKAWIAAVLVGLVALVGLAVGARFEPETSAPSADIARIVPTAEAPARSKARPPAARRRRPEPAPLPRSLRNTNVDGSVAVDGNDRIIPTRALRDLFDYYLSGVGEYGEHDPAAAVKNRLRAYAHTHGLTGAAAHDLLALFDRYMTYRQAAAAYIAAKSTEEIGQALRILSDMRIAYLGVEMAEAFYGDQERRTRAAIARRQGRAGAESFTDAQRKAIAPVELARRVQTLRQNGAGEAAIAAAREQAVGPAATQRLEALDARRTQWQTTFNAYRKERAALMASGMTERDRQRALAALRGRYFSKRDIKRVEALDQMAEGRAK